MRLLTVLAWAPITAIVAFTAFLIADVGIDELGDRPLKHILAHWTAAAMIVLVKLVAGIALASHASKNPKVPKSERTSWMIRLVLFTEVRGPAYALEYLAQKKT